MNSGEEIKKTGLCSYVNPDLDLEASLAMYPKKMYKKRASLAWPKSRYLCIFNHFILQLAISGHFSVRNTVSTFIVSFYLSS